MFRVAEALFLCSIALLPWGGILTISRLHEHAQWSDAIFAVSFLLWAASLFRARRLPSLPPGAGAMGLYLAAAILSYVLADPRAPSGAAKLVGMGMLVAMAIMTADLASTGGLKRIIAVVATTSGFVAFAAFLGVALFYLGESTFLIGTYGDLLPGPYARAQAGFTHPNQLASFCIFVYGLAGRPDSGLSERHRRLVQFTVFLTSMTTFSRGIVALALAAAVGRAKSRLARRGAAVLWIIVAFALVSTAHTNLAIDPTRPWAWEVRPGPSPRQDAWSSSWETFLMHPLFGTGPGTLPGRHSEYGVDAHNTPLNIAATLGLPALLAFLAVPWMLWRDRRRPTDRATWSMMGGLALDGLCQDIEDFRHLWVAFGLAGCRPAASFRTEGRDPAVR